MGRIYFFCDSQMNVLTAYFMMKIYHDTSDYKKILLVSNNSEKSVACARRAEKLELWSEVFIIEEAFQGEESLLQIIDNYEVERNDIVYLFALQNRFARGFYKKAQEEKAKISIVDEGVILFKNFLQWQKNNPIDVFADIDVINKNVEGWCYEPAIFDLPENVHLNKIQLQEYLQDEIKFNILRSDVKNIFDVSEDENISIIYFDQYYTLMGRTVGDIEKYLIEKIAWICSGLNFVVKPHPMERGFVNKYKGINLKTISSKDSPWEAIYFVNFYRKKDKKIICLSGESTAMATPLIMYGDTNYYIILLRNIFNRYMKPHEWMLGDYFEGLKKIPFGSGQHLYIPNDFKDFNNIIKMLIKSNQDNLISDIDDRLIEKLSKEIIEIRPPYFLCALQLGNSEKIIKSIVAEQIICDEDFEVKYDLSSTRCENDVFFRWIPCEKCFIRFKDILVEVYTLDDKYLYNSECLISEQGTQILGDGFVENLSSTPSYLLEIPVSNIEKIIIKGKWKIDFNKDRLINTMDLNWKIKIQELEARLNKREQEWKNQYQELSEIINKKEEEWRVQNRELNKLINKKDECIRIETEKYEKIIDKIESENNTLNNKIMDISNSTSWKITKPLRAISMKLRK